MENASKGINMEPVVRPLISKWRDELIDQVDSVLRGRFNASISTVERALAPGGKASQFERLDKAKQAIDEWIGKAKQSADKRSPTLARLLTNMKNELVDAMDGVQTNNVGTLYKQARDVFGDAAQMRKAIELGRGALRQESEFTADQYAKLTPAEQRMFRTGLFGDIEKSIATSKRGADITQIFDSPRAQEILETVIGRGGAVPPGPLGETMARMNAQRPERIGQMIQGEKQFIGTRNKVLGGSPTAERLGDDSNFKAMAGIVEQLRSAKSVSDVAVKATTAAINQIFGFRADMSAALARKLFTADRAELERILMGVEERMGPNRAAQFRNLMEQNAAQLMQGTANVAGAQRGDGRGPRPPSRPPGPP